MTQATTRYEGLNPREFSKSAKGKGERSLGASDVSIKNFGGVP